MRQWVVLRNFTQRFEPVWRSFDRGARNRSSLACEDKLRTAEWGEYSTLANEKEFLDEYTQGAFLVTKNRRLERDIQFIFGAAAFFTVALGSGYIFNNIWRNNAEKERRRQLQQEKHFFTRRKLDNFTTTATTTSELSTINITGEVELISSNEVPFQHLLRISLENTSNRKIKEPNTVRNVIIPATALSQVYTSECSKEQSSFSFQSQTELQMRIKNIVIDWDNNTIQIPKSVETHEEIPELETFEVFQANSASYDHFRAWIQQILIPILCYSSTASLVAFIVSKRAWRKVRKNLDWITTSIFRPWRQGMLLGGRVALITTTVCSFFTFGAIYSSYKTKSYFFSDPDAPEFDCLENGSQWIQVPTLCSIFILGSVVLSSWFIIPAGAITGRIITGKIYQEMVHNLPRSTIAVRKFTKSLKK